MQVRFLSLYVLYVRISIMSFTYVYWKGVWTQLKSSQVRDWIINYGSSVQYIFIEHLLY